MSGLLKAGGVAIVSFFEGTGEGYEDPTKDGQKRFFSKFSEEELANLLQPHFTILEKQKIEIKKMHRTAILYVLQSRTLETLVSGLSV